MKPLFLDEPGDHSLDVIDPQYPIFVLGGIIVDAEYAEGDLAGRVRQFKLDLFGRDDLVLHTADIARNKNGFENLKDSGFRRRFFEELNELMQTLNYKVIACAIKKDAHLSRYGSTAVDPYLLSLDILIERFWHEIGKEAGGGKVIAERRSWVLDHQLTLAWSSLRIRGTNFIRAARLKERISDLSLHPKAENLAGLQLADLVVSPIARYVLNKPIKEDFRIIEA